VLSGLVSRFRARRRDERGAVAIVYALLAVMLMGLAALGTDIGNEVNRHTMTQTQADFGAFAAAAKMTQTGHVGNTPSAAVLQAITDSMNANAPQDDNGGITAITAAQLTDANLSNGDVRYVSVSGQDGLQVTAPNHYVSFGMARILGYQGATVGAKAVINIYSPGLRVLPMFAVQGCDYGLQTIANPANGHVSPVAPTLAFDTDSNDTALVQPATTLDSNGNVVATITPGTTGNMLQLAGKNWDQTTKIGFFRGDSTDPTLVQTQSAFWLMGDATKTNLNASGSGYSSNPQTTVQLNIPDAVATVQTVWWVRAFDKYNNQWSPRSEAVPIVVGNAVLQCGAGSLDGNFGTLKLPRTDVPTSDDLPVNIAAGLQSPLSLTKHVQWATDSPAGECVDGVQGAVSSPGYLGPMNANTNCVDTDTGLAANVATQGLITGVDGKPGLLTTAGTTPSCNSSKNLVIQNTNYPIDNNRLTCYLQGGKSLATICDPSYSGGQAVDDSITADPRFVWVPVLKVKPDSGGSNTWSIVDVRPGFITDETATSSAVKGSNTGTSANGVVVDNNGVTQLNVVFFNIDAMPTDAQGRKIDYLGVGHPIVTLIN